MGGSQGGSQGAAGKVNAAQCTPILLPSTDLLYRERMAKTPSDLSP